MRTSNRRAAIAASLVLGCLCLTPAGAQKAPSAKEQLRFGIDMAQRGLWSEALFRFRLAERLSPEDAAILNNMAVSYEALGLFDEALETYQRALRIDSANRGLKRNYSRFAEFYQSLQRAREREEEAEAEAETGTEGEDPGDPSADASRRRR